MSAASDTAAPAPSPDPDRAAGPAYTPGRFAGFLREIMDYGRHLSVAVRLRAQRADFPRFTLPFGTSYLPDILRRIDGAIRRALVLEEHPLRQLGRLKPRRVRAASAAAPRAAVRRDMAPEPPRAVRPAGDPHYAGWPSIRKLAAEIRRRSVAEVLTDICRDLGITPRHALWPEMCAAITAHGGSVEALERDADTRWCVVRWLQIPFTKPDVSTWVFWPSPWSDQVTAAAAVAATGPP